MRQPSRIRTALVALALSLGLAGFAAPAMAVSSDSASSQSSNVSVSPQAIGSWVLYESNFKSLATCTSRGATILAIYGGSHYGAVAGVQCLPRKLAQCPPSTVYDLYVRYNDGGGRVAAPTSVREADTTAVTC